MFMFFKLCNTNFAIETLKYLQMRQQLLFNLSNVYLNLYHIPFRPIQCYPEYLDLD
jgi:hypothetical protein